MDYILGVDGGGTKTTVLITDIKGNSIAESRSGSSNYKSVGTKIAGENISKAILKAIEEMNSSEKFTFKGACFGLSGNDFSEDKKIYHKIIFVGKLKDYLDPSKTIICNDTRIGLAAGSDSKNGIVIMSGTGSNCYGINEKGEEARVNGLDYILADEGSGYEIGLKALKALIRAYDGRGEDTLLLKTILEDLKIKSVTELVKWAHSGSFFKEKIAAIAKTVCRTAKMKDKVSIRILKEEAEEVSLSVETVAEKLKLMEKEFDLVFVGRVFKCEEYFKSVVIKNLKDKFPKINLIPLIRKPVEGAVKLALKLCNS